jgi:cytochrome c biogenesis protein CcdA/thiol-disulfide isomerase/thioredoxin
MVPVLAFALLAGCLTILAPCTLPVVPLVLGAASGDGRRRVLGLLAGFGLTFVAVTVLFASILAAAGLTTGALRIGAAAVLGAFGISLVIPRFEIRVEALSGPLARVGLSLAGQAPSSRIGGLILGAAIGLIWAPCVGPIMAAVIALAATHGPSLETLVIALAYVGGAAIPMGLIAGWGQRATLRLRAASGSRLRRSFGVVMVLSALLVVTGLDFSIENSASAFLPSDWSGALGSVQQQAVVQDELGGMEATGVSDAGSGPTTSASAPRTSAPGQGLPESIAAARPANVVLEDLGPAPDFTGITAWINSPPLTMAALRGKVVLVEFWTFECINCIHVQLYVKAWYDRYASSGLVVVGVHTPELSFERDLGNVRQAVSQDGLRFPVAVDPSFATWNAFRNNFWPAFYFIDRFGQIRHTHFGEGDYPGSEQVIRQLLSAPS